MLNGMMQDLTGREFLAFVAIGALVLLGTAPFLFYGIWRRLRKNPPAKYLWLTLLNASLFVGSFGLPMIPLFLGAFDAAQQATQQAANEADAADEVAAADQATAADSTEAAALTQIFTVDEAYRLSIPGDWKAGPKKTDSQDLPFWISPDGNQGLSLGGVSKLDLVDPSLKTHLESVVDAIDFNDPDVEISEPRTRQIAGCPAMDMTVTAEVNNIRVVFLLIAVDTPNHNVDLRFWTPLSQFETCRATYEQIAQSLEPVEKDLPH